MPSELQKVFIRRLDEEMQARHISGNALAVAAKVHGLKLGQRSIARMLKGEQDPTLEKLEVISYLLGIPAWFLLTDQAEQRIIRPPTVEKASSGVVAFPNPYPKVFRKTLDESRKNLRTKRHKR